MMQKKETNSGSGIMLFLIFAVNVGVLVVMILINGNLGKINEKIDLNNEYIDTLSNKILSDKLKDEEETEYFEEIPSEREATDDEDESEEDSNSDNDNENEDGDEEENEENADNNSENDSATKSTESLYKEFAKDEEKALEEYQGTKIIVKGDINEITETDSGKVKIEMKAGNGTLACLSKKGNENTAQILKDEITDKDNVKIEGLVDGFFDEEIELEDCSIIF